MQVITPILAYVAEVVPLKQGLKHSQLEADYYSDLSCRGSSIKTRIETQYLAYKRETAQVFHVAEVVPLKQGLKHIVNTNFQKFLSCRGSSIKTRIETQPVLHRDGRWRMGCRGSSIKTRIETHKVNKTCYTKV